MAAWATGISLGPYVLVAPIGAGGMGEVWKARDTRLDRIVAVKRLKAKHSARFEQEAHAIAALNHPHICQIFDIGPDYLVLEYIEGQPLKGPQAVEEAVRLAAQIVEALDAAHRKGVVHRDLKPANILVTAEGQVKLLDFGVAKLIAVEDGNLTRTVGAPLTPACAAPEQLLGGAITTATDVYTLGLLLFELQTGTQPWSPAGQPIAHAMRVVLERAAPAPSLTAAGLSDPPLPPRLLRGDFDAIVESTPQGACASLRDSGCPEGRC